MVIIIYAVYQNYLNKEGSGKEENLFVQLYTFQQLILLHLVLFQRKNPLPPDEMWQKAIIIIFFSPKNRISKLFFFSNPLKNT